LQFATSLAATGTRRAVWDHTALHGNVVSFQITSEFLVMIQLN